MRLSHILSGFAWGGILLAGTWAFDTWKTHRLPTNMRPDSQPCSQLPGLGISSILDRTMPTRQDAQYGILSIRNNQPVTLVAVLLDPGMSRKLQVVTVGPGGVAHAQVPSGQYGLGLMSGQNWCSLERGFIGGTMHSITGGVQIKPRLMTQAIVEQGAIPGDIDIRFRDLYRTEEIREGGLEARSDEKNIVSTQGAVNGVPVSFVIDTGASTLTLPPDIARQAGIRCASEGQFVTATGAAIGCRGVAKEVSFGPFRLYEVEVAVLPGGESALLGMNVLRRFTMVWRDDAVRITAVDASLKIPQHGHPSPDFAPIIPWPAR